MCYKDKKNDFCITKFVINLSVGHYVIHYSFLTIDVSVIIKMELNFLQNLPVFSFYRYYL